MSGFHDKDVTAKRPSILRHKLSGDDNSIESSVTLYARKNPSSENELRLSLAKTETMAVVFLRCFVIGVLILAAIALSSATYLIISHNNHKFFVSSFTNDANRLKIAYYDVTIQRVLVSASFIIRYLMQAALQGEEPMDTKIIGTLMICS
jgi:uncharacterized membrane protein (Fun14 family)